MEIGTEISQKIKTAIKSKLVEFGSYVDDELPDYIMVMVANKRSQAQMIEDLNLFLGENSKMFCDWLHDLLQKLQEVTEGAFEVKVPLKMKSDAIRSESKAKSTDESLKISKMSQKPTPITVSNTSENNHEESFDNQAEDLRTEDEWHTSKSAGGSRKSTNKKGKTLEKYHKKEEKNPGMVQSAVVIQKRPTLPPSKQANPALLKKAVKEAQVSVEDVQHSEYNPELPASSDMPNISSQNPESKKRQRELLLEEHKKLQRLKSQQEENEENREPMIELEVAEDDDLFATEETVVRDRRIVVEKNAESDTAVEVIKKEKSKSLGKKENKLEKRKLDEGVSNQDRDQSQSASESGDDTKSQEKQRSVKTKEKRRKPKFIVTLEGVGSEFEKKYEKEHSRRKKRRKSSHREDDLLATSNAKVPVIPVYPPLIQGVHQVAGIPQNHQNPVPPQVQVIPTTMTAPLTVDTAADIVTENVEYEDEDIPSTSTEKCRFWPQCKNGNDCPYYHPDITCKHFPNCRYGKDCSYLHPPCKFGSKCTSSSCSYSHLPSTPAVSSETPTLCRYHPYCTRRDCPFIHPVEKPCRYGTNCTRPGCAFIHSTPPPRQLLKWVAPKEHVSERQFAVKEASTTPLQVQ